MATTAAAHYGAQVATCREPARWAALRLLDERDPYGGRLKAILFLVHPGPSLLVTAVVVVAAGLALRAVPPPSTALRLTLVMLPAQFAIGAANDLADRDADRLAKPHKPLVREAVGVRTAASLVFAGMVTCLATAASLGWAALSVAVVGLSAGLAYDLGLKRSAASWLAFWAGIAAVPLGAYAAVHRISASLWWSIPLAGLLALGLHCANALPDLASDRAAAVRSLPVRIGPTTTSGLVLAAPVATSAMALALRDRLGQAGPWLPAAAAVFCLCALLGVALTAGRRPRAPRAAFPLVALGGAVMGVAWLASLPSPSSAGP